MQDCCTQSACGMSKHAWSLHLELVVVFLLPLSGQKLTNLLTSYEELVAVAPIGVCALAQALLFAGYQCEEHQRKQIQQGVDQSGIAINDAPMSRTIRTIRVCHADLLWVADRAGGRQASARDALINSTHVQLPASVSAECEQACSRHVCTDLRRSSTHHVFHASSASCTFFFAVYDHKVSAM